MTTNEHISRLQEAQDLLREALDILKDVARDPSNNGHFAKHVIEDIETATNGAAWSLRQWIHAANHPELYASDMLGKPAPKAPKAMSTKLTPAQQIIVNTLAMGGYIVLHKGIRVYNAANKQVSAMSRTTFDALQSKGVIRVTDQRNDFGRFKWVLKGEDQ